MRILDVIAVSCLAAGGIWAGFDYVKAPTPGEVSAQTSGFDYDRANSAYESGDYATALKLISPWADAGDPNAQNFLGVLYNYGHGVQENDVEAVSWFQKSAEQGFAKGQTSLAVMHLYGGVGVPHNAEEGLYWLKRAAAQGFPQAEYMLGLHQSQTAETTGDRIEAGRLINSAADQGYVPAIAQPGPSEGLQNRPMKMGALLDAAEKGSAEAMYYLGNIHFYGNGVPRNVRTAVQWYEKAITAGSDQAAIRLGQMYISGQGVKTDFEKGATIIKRAAESGSRLAQYTFGSMFNPMVQPDQYCYWMEQAAGNGDLLGMLATADCYTEGVGVPKNDKTAFQWNMRAAQQDMPQGVLAVAEAHMTGTGTKKDLQMGVDWLERAAELNHGQAQFYLARHYQGGSELDPEPDVEKAYFWFRISESGEYFNYSSIADFSAGQAQKFIDQGVLTSAQLDQLEAQISEWKLKSLKRQPGRHFVNPETADYEYCLNDTVFSACWSAETDLAMND